MNADRPIGVAGAGSIGCFVGGMLAAAGRRVALLARPRLLAEIEANGLRLTDFDGAEQRLAANAITLSDDPSIFGQAGVVLVTVKSADTAEMADIIARHAPQDAVIVSLQNGVGNVAVLRESLPGRRCSAAWCRSTWSRSAKAGSTARPPATSLSGEDDAGTAASLSVPGLQMRAHRQHRRRAMGQADRQSQQRAQRALRHAAAPATGAARHGEGCSPTRWRRGWRRSRPTASRRFRRRRSRRPGRRRCCACPTSVFDADPGTDHEDRSGGAFLDVGGSAARPPHRDRLSAGRHHRARRPARLEVPLSRRIVALIRRPRPRARARRD